MWSLFFFLLFYSFYSPHTYIFPSSRVVIMCQANGAFSGLQERVSRACSRNFSCTDLLLIKFGSILQRLEPALLSLTVLQLSLLSVASLSWVLLRCYCGYIIIIFFTISLFLSVDFFSFLFTISIYHIASLYLTDFS